MLEPVSSAAYSEPPLSGEQRKALEQACAPVSLLSFPPPEVIRFLRQCGYVEIVLGGVQITPKGLERLLRERRRNFGVNDAQTLNPG